MKNDAIFINASRGEICDQNALLEALQVQCSMCVCMYVCVGKNQTKI